MENLEHLSHTIPDGNKTQARTHTHNGALLGAKPQPLGRLTNRHETKETSINIRMKCVCVCVRGVFNYSKTVISWSIFSFFFFNHGLSIFFNQILSVHEFDGGNIYSRLQWPQNVFNIEPSPSSHWAQVGLY